GPDSGECSRKYFPGFAPRFRNFGVALPLSHLGAGSVCLRSRAGCDATRRRPEKIWVIRPAAPGPPPPARRRAAIQHAPDLPAAGQYHLRRPGDDRAEAARLDAWLFE